MAPVFYVAKVIAVYLQNCCSEEGLAIAPYSFL